MRIAYFSPLNPLKSGISDFSEELIQELQKYVEIDLFVDGYKPSSKFILENLNVYDMNEFKNDDVRGKYDEYIYHIGNNHQYHEKILQYSLIYPGIVELHDISIHNMIAGITIGRNNIEAYKKEMEYSHGQKGVKDVEKFLNGKILPPWETEQLKYTLNKRIIDNSKAVIVHSDFAKQMIKGINRDKIVKNIYLHSPDIIDDYEQYKLKCRKDLEIDEKILIFASFGFATKSKRINEIIYALRKLKDTGFKFLYYIVGQVDKELGLEKIINQLQLKENIVITGFAEIDTMKRLIGACDICFNLRNPTQGESSASLHRAIGMGKVVFVSNTGAFREYPDEVVIKISTREDEIEDIYNKLVTILGNDEVINKYKDNALKFAKSKCSLEKNVMTYNEFFKNIHYEIYSETDFIEVITDKFENLGIYEENIINRIINRFELLLCNEAK